MLNFKIGHVWILWKEHKDCNIIANFFLSSTFKATSGLISFSNILLVLEKN